MLQGDKAPHRFSLSGAEDKDKCVLCAGGPRKTIMGRRRRQSRWLSKKGARKEKNINVGAAHIQATFNNTVVFITDPNGKNVATWSSGRESLGSKDHGRGTHMLRRWAAAGSQKAIDMGMKQLDVFVERAGRREGVSYGKGLAGSPGWRLI